MQNLATWRSNGRHNYVHEDAFEISGATNIPKVSGFAVQLTLNRQTGVGMLEGEKPGQYVIKFINAISM